MSRMHQSSNAHKKFEEEKQKAIAKGEKIKISEMPRRELVIMYYQGYGYKIIPGRTAKYITMEKPGQETKVFVGKNGGVHKGTNISSAFSISINYDNLRAYISKKVRGN